MNTFLPYPDFKQSAQSLDRQRLGKQRVECKQLLMGQFPNHPCSKMWLGFEYQLCEYTKAVCDEWMNRGYQDSVKQWVIDHQSKLSDTGLPSFIGRDDFHLAQKSNLVRKDPVWYPWDVPNNLPYLWR